MKTIALSTIAALCLGAVGPAFAQEAEASAESGPIEVIRANDAALTCVQIADEAARLSQTMGGDPGGGLFGRLGGVAAAGAAMVIPGAGLVTAGVDALTRPERDRKEAEAAAVRHRWYYLNGLYAGQDCLQTTEAAPAAAPQAAPAPAPAVPPTAAAPAPAVPAARVVPAPSPASAPAAAAPLPPIRPAEPG
jgi:hypothetical protein